MTVPRTARQDDNGRLDHELELLFGFFASCRPSDDDEPEDLQDKLMRAVSAGERVVQVALELYASRKSLPTAVLLSFEDDLPRGPGALVHLEGGRRRFIGYPFEMKS